jgi:hypothetical protein
LSLSGAVLSSSKDGVVEGQLSGNIVLRLDCAPLSDSYDSTSGSLP